jgi:DivIVA domain-containing protein
MPDERKEQLISAELVAQQGFASAVRGYDKTEVREFLTRVSEQINRLLERERELQAQLREAEERAAHPELDEATLAGALGEETARILRSAQEASADIRAKAEETALRDREEAHQYAVSLRQQADSLLNERTAEAERAAQAIQSTATEEAERISARARDEVESILAEAKRQGEELIDEAEHNRERVMADLHRRRLVAATQVEQLRAGRERLLDAYRTVRRTLEEVTDDLQRADAEARAAAEAAGRRPPPEMPAETLGVPMEVLPEAVPLEVDEGEGGEGAEPSQPAAPEVPPAAEAAPEAEVPAEPVVVAESGEPDEGVRVRPAMEGVFAKLRAQRSKEPEVAEAPPASAAAEAAPAESPVAEAAPEAPVSDADEAGLQQREAALQPIEAALARRLKRALQDEQNEILDRLRAQKGKLTAAAVLPTPPAHAERYVTVSRELLEKAAAAGAASVPPEVAVKKPDAAGLDDVGQDLAATIVDPLRRRLERSFDGADEDATVIGDRISAAYRELKTQRIEQVAADHVVAAHTRGVFGAVADGAGVRWVVYDTGGPCPDCDDNVLAGIIAKGEPFPTGQLHPPAHAGCQCLLVPEPLAAN